MLDILFVVPLLLCISPMLYLSFFTLRAAEFVQSERDRPQEMDARGD
jgi:hypothetical protein